MSIRRFFAILICTFAGLFTVGLDAAEKKLSEPEKTVSAFFTAMAKADFATAKKYVADKELTGMLTFMEELAKESPGTREDAKKEFAYMLKAKIELVEIKDSSAKVRFNCTEKGKKKTETYSLKKIGGSWKIAD